MSATREQTLAGLRRVEIDLAELDSGLVSPDMPCSVPELRAHLWRERARLTDSLARFDAAERLAANRARYGEQREPWPC